MITKYTIEQFFNAYRVPIISEGYEIAQRVRVHADGLYPQKLIDTLRPNEPLEIKEYRKSIFKSYTKGYFNKILTLLSKIQKSEDWRIDFPAFEGATPEKEKISRYLSENYPYFDSLENYVFSILLKTLLTDPNAIIFVLPIDFNIAQNEFYEPFAFVYNCEDVLFFEKNLLIVKQSIVGTKENYIFCDSENVCFVEVDKSNEKHVITFVEYKNIIGEIPSFRFGGEIKKTTQKPNDIEFLYDSFVTPCLNNFDEAARLYSDHQANLVLHIYPEKYIYQSSECKSCTGTGRVRFHNDTTNETETVSCNACKGSGFKVSPFGVHEINPRAMNENSNIPSPPIGYIEKPLGLIQALKTEINEQCRQGLSSLGLEFLYEVPASQSGIAKEFDREEINTFVGMVARHLVENIVKPIIWYTMQWRYKVSLTENTIKKNMPIVNVPTKFDTLTSEIIGNRLKNSIQNGYDYSTRKALEFQYAEKEFGKGSAQVKLLKTLYELETMHNKTEDEKMTILANRGVSQIDYVVSSNLGAFINRAINEVPNYLDLPYKEKKAKAYEYANETIKALPNPIPLM